MNKKNSNNKLNRKHDEHIEHTVQVFFERTKKKTPDHSECITMHQLETHIIFFCKAPRHQQNIYRLFPVKTKKK